MIIKNLNIKELHVNVYDTDALSFLTTVNITDVNIRKAINNLVVQMKLIGVWSKMDYVYPFVGGTSASHQRNLISPGAYILTYVGGLTHSVNGIKGNGTTGYAKPGYLMASARLNDMSLGVYATVRGLVTGINSGLGVDGRTIYLYPTAIYPYALTNGFAHLINKVGISQFSRRGASNIICEGQGNVMTRNVVSEWNTWFPNNPERATPYILARRDESSGVSVFSDDTLGFAYAGRGLSDTELLKYGVIITEFQKRLNR